MPNQSYLNSIPQIAKNAYIHDSAYLIGKVIVGENSSIWPLCVLRGDVAAITIGSNTNIQDGTIIHGTHAGPYTGKGKDTVIGDNVTIGHRATLHACNVENNAFIGMGATVLDKAIIRENAMLGANTLVIGSQDITGGYLWLGQPARQIRKLTNKEIDYLEYSAKHYAKLANSHTGKSP